MSGLFLLDWLGLAVSIFNGLVMLWLGLTALLSAERRTLWVWLASGGLLVGTFFFVAHSLVLIGGAAGLLTGFDLWWQVGWLPVILAPYAWYLWMLWYNGFWESPPPSDPPNALRRRQRLWFGFSLVYLVLLGLLLATATPLQEFSRIQPYEEFSIPPGSRTGESLPPGASPGLMLSAPLLVLSYPPYILLCFGLALDALLRPAPAARLLGDLARRRARPWLLSASLALLLLSFMVGAVFVWLIQASVQHPIVAELVYSQATLLSVFDLTLISLLLAAVLLIGQAMVTYEIFTGKTLPRLGLRRQWYTALLLTASLSLLVSWSVMAQLPPAPVLLVLSLFVMGFYVVLNRQSAAEQEANTRRLRPLVTGGRLLNSILAGSTAPADIDLSASFAALCQDVLTAGQGILAPLGSFAALGLAPLHYPAGTPPAIPPLAQILSRLTSPQTPGMPLDPHTYGGMIWAAPLWSERGLVGLLLLGEKRGGGLYSLEEIEMARASAERLIDLQASAEMARRLVTLQRQHLAESGVLDRRTRRVLHDDVLPRLHTALLQLSGQPAGPEATEALEQLAGVHRQIADLLRQLPSAATPELGRLGLAGALRWMAEEEMRSSFDQVTWQAEPEAERRLPGLPPLTAEVIYGAAREAVRNAARHARPASDARALHLYLRLAWCNGLEITIEDNGVGLDGSEAHPPDASASTGQGLALHSTLMALVNGSLTLESLPGQFTRVVLTLPDSG